MVPSGYSAQGRPNRTLTLMSEPSDRTHAVIAASLGLALLIGGGLAVAEHRDRSASAAAMVAATTAAEEAADAAAADRLRAKQERRARALANKRQKIAANVRSAPVAAAPLAGEAAAEPPVAAAAAPVEAAAPDRAALAARLEQIANVLGYGPVQDRQGMAYVMQIEVCEPVAAGTKSWGDVVREDIENGAPGDAAARMANFLKTEFCTSY